MQVGTYRIYNNISSTRRLNLYSSGSASNGMNVVLYTKDSSNEQLWYFDGSRLRPETNRNFCLDRYAASTYLNNADIWSANDDANQLLYVLETAEGDYKIKLRSKVNGEEYYLTAYSNANGTSGGKTTTSAGNVFWAPYSGKENQKWTFEFVSSGGGGGTGNYCWPTESTKINTNYPYDGVGHLGIDISPVVSKTPGDDVYAYMDGTVSFVRNDISNNPKEGYTVRIHHENPLNNGYERIRTQYMHLESAPLVSVGQNVKAGDLIGYMGNTGNVYPAPTESEPGAGTHLHFEVRGGTASQYPLNGSSGYNVGEPIDPEYYLALT